MAGPPCQVRFTALEKNLVVTIDGFLGDDGMRLAREFRRLAKDALRNRRRRIHRDS